MKKIKKFLSTALSVPLLMSLDVSYNKNCGAMECEHVKYNKVACNHADIPIRLKVGPNSSRKEILDALIELKNYIQLKLHSVNFNARQAMVDLINRDFFTSHYNMNNAAEVIAAKVRHDWLDAYYRYSYIRTIRGDIGTDINLAGYFYTMLRNSGFESYVISIPYRDVENIEIKINLLATVVRLDNKWYCIPCDLYDHFDNILTLEEFLCSMFEKDLLFTSIALEHILPNGNHYEFKANYNVNSREEAFREAFDIGNSLFEQIAKLLRENRIPAPIFNGAL